jgi:hypothetical protein
MTYQISKFIFFFGLVGILMIFSFTHINSSFAKTEGREFKKEFAEAKKTFLEPAEEEEEEEEEEDC